RTRAASLRGRQGPGCPGRARRQSRSAPGAVGADPADWRSARPSPIKPHAAAAESLPPPAAQAEPASVAIGPRPFLRRVVLLALGTPAPCVRQLRAVRPASGPEHDAPPLRPVVAPAPAPRLSLPTPPFRVLADRAPGFPRARPPWLRSLPQITGAAACPASLALCGRAASLYAPLPTGALAGDNWDKTSHSTVYNKSAAKPP